ncbi:tetratricopeptide repeat protein [Psychrobacter sp. BI730]|uniref:tetratricopeptide repeat protein n=1 Tax=Psychrobacter sp. BI730 TaxID=2705463 RepID=UPI0015C813E9|nr:tetratricopeptide repeat protein [Psychrobacter sp. BI730]NYR10865.1 sel1 repeat family protein [Psychrobacter sp. BI730]
MTNSWAKMANCSIPLLLSLALVVPAMADTNLSQIQTSANQGDPSAQYSLGLKYYSGEGVSQSYNKAFEWYQKAAMQNHAMAQSNIGQMYYYGFGIPKNQVKAYDWFKKSAYQGNDKAQAKIDEMSQIGFVMNFIDSEFTKTSYHMINNVEYSPINDHYLVGQLSDSSSISESMSFSSGESYALAAICAMRCRNVTLTIYDRYGDIISEVIDADGTTAVQFEAAYTGDYTVDLNFDCQASSCLYKVQGYEASMSLDWLMYI